LLSNFEDENGDSDGIMGLKVEILSFVSCENTPSGAKKRLKPLKKAIFGQ